MAKLEDAIAKATPTKKGFDYQVSDPGPDHAISFASSGPVLDDKGQRITTDHSVLTDVAGHEVWLHHEKHHHANKRVHMPMAHAKDMGLIPPETNVSDEQDISQAPDVQPAPVPKENIQQPSEITKPGSSANPTTPGAPSSMDNKATDNEVPKTKTNS